MQFEFHQRAHCDVPFVYGKWLMIMLFKMGLVLLPVTALGCTEWMAKIVAIEGLVQHDPNSEAHWQPVRWAQSLCAGASISVSANSRAVLYLRNNTIVNLNANSTLFFPEATEETFFWVELKEGLAHFISRIVNPFKVETPYINAMVEGTEFIVSASESGSVSVLEGKVTAYNDAQRMQLSSGQQAVAASREHDLSRLTVKAAEIVEWAIYYPPVLSLAELPVASETDQSLIQSAVQALQHHRIDQAVMMLEAHNNPSVTVQLARAALLLQLGRLTEFNEGLSGVLQGPQRGLGHSLKAIAELSRNDVRAGMHSAETAVKYAPNQAAAWMALSYAQQADLNLDEALNSARQAVSVQSGSLLAQMRLTELYLAQGDVNAAYETLRNVPEPEVGSAILEGGKGFVHLFRLNIKQAQAHFRQALVLDSTNPNYHLGLGLTLLRSGELEQGRREIEYAVSLDPMRSVLRSYMGRAYFEEKRDHEAIKQWNLAKQFDPNDPTPYFYSGVHKLYANDPLGAIDELEMSRALNDKRAIYRAETLLQSDAASRGAALARVYDAVGYDQGVLVNAQDAIRRDFTNAEGHRLLADFYTRDPRFESARVAELVQSQLWQPLSAFPLQPQLSEADLSSVTDIGMQRPSFNEYHTLFTQDGVYGAFNSYLGSDNTWGNDAVGSLLSGPIAMSVGQFHFESDGWRSQADQKQDIYDGFLQWQLSPATALEFESRKLDLSRGNVAPAILFSNDMINREETIRQTNRAGITHFYNKNRAFAVSLVHQDWDVASRSLLASHALTSMVDLKLQLLDAQWVYCCDKNTWIFGVNRYKQMTDEAIVINAVSSASPQQAHYRDTRSQPESASVYLDYSRLLNPTLGINLKVALQHMESELRRTESEFNFFEDVFVSSTALPFTHEKRSRQLWLPSAGLFYNPSEFLGFRMAYYESVAQGLLDDYTLESTEVFGFTRLFDGNIGVESANTGLALDCRFTVNKCGLSYIRRALRTPSPRVLGVGYLEENEDIVNAYYVTHTPLGLIFSVGAQWTQKYVVSEQVRYLMLPADIAEIRLYRLPVMFQYYTEGGFSFHVEQSYYAQTVRMAQNDEQLRQNTWMTNVKMGYRNRWCNCDFSLGVNNFFNQEEEFLSFSERELAFYPGRFLYGPVSLNLQRELAFYPRRFWYGSISLSF